MPHPVNHTLTIQWLASLDKIMPKPRAEKFIRDLAAARPIFVESIVPAADRVGTGETPIGITFVRFVLTYNKQGANLDYVRDYNMLGDGQYISLGAKAPRANAGRAFIDFFLDDESMKIQANTGGFVNRKGHLSAAGRRGQNQVRADVSIRQRRFRNQEERIPKNFSAVALKEIQWPL